MGVNSLPKTYSTASFCSGTQTLRSVIEYGLPLPILLARWARVNGRLLLSGDQVDLWVVHRGGFIIDLLAGFVLSCRSTRVVGAVLVTAFHLMNSCMFDIGTSLSRIGLYLPGFTDT